jgi:predicted acylesterase/phospholipase RssA
MIRRLIALCLALLVAACASDRPLAFDCPRFDEFRIPVGATPAEPGAIGTADALPPLVGTIAETFGTSAAGEEAPPSNFLILSGGGQWGAFGAGFIDGWSNKGTGADSRPPQFNMVTGVSTGSLQATFAFLGRDYDDELLEAYSITAERQLVKRHGNTFFLSHASMADLAPLERYIRLRLRPMLDAVAAPENAGRKLLVGVVDGLDGGMYAIDLTRIATELSGTERENCYAGALLASSAVPIVFRQVRVGGKPYLDGGVRQSVFVTEVQDAAGQALAAGGRTGTMYVLMNGDVTTKPVDDLPPKLLPTLNRLRTLVFNQVELSSIFNVAQRFPTMTTKLATAAGHICKAPPAEKDAIFSPTMMECLRKYGRSRWDSGVPWTVYQMPAAAGSN